LNREILIGEKRTKDKMKKYTDIFPLRLKSLQHAYGLSLSETAALLNVNARSMIFDWENKKVSFY
jgi:DNA-binding transcriptional regulator YiaG